MMNNILHCVAIVVALSSVCGCSQPGGGSGGGSAGFCGDMKSGHWEFRTGVDGLSDGPWRYFSMSTSADGYPQLAVYTESSAVITQRWTGTEWEQTLKTTMGSPPKVTPVENCVVTAPLVGPNGLPVLTTLESVWRWEVSEDYRWDVVPLEHDYLPNHQAVAFDPVTGGVLSLFSDVHDGDFLRFHRWLPDEGWSAFESPSNYGSVEIAVVGDAVDGTPIVAYDDMDTERLQVKRWDAMGESWVSMGFASSGGFSHASMSSSPVGDSPCISFWDEGPAERGVRVTCWKGGMDWHDLGIVGPDVWKGAPKVLMDPADGLPIVMLTDIEDSIRKWNGASDWESLEFPVQLSQSHSTAWAMDRSDGRLVVAHMDSPDADGPYRVQRWEEGTTWTDLGLVGDENMDDIDLAIHGDDILAIYRDKSLAFGGLHLKSWDGDTTWSDTMEPPTYGWTNEGVLGLTSDGTAVLGAPESAARWHFHEFGQWVDLGRPDTMEFAATGSFGTDGHLAIDSQNRVLLAGTNNTSEFRPRVARWDPDGGWEDLGLDADHPMPKYSVVVGPSDIPVAFFIGGNQSNPNIHNVYQWEPGNTWKLLPLPEGVSLISDLSVDNEDRPIITSVSSDQGSPDDRRLMLFRWNGSSWENLGFASSQVSNNGALNNPATRDVVEGPDGTLWVFYYYYIPMETVEVWASALAPGSHDWCEYGMVLIVNGINQIYLEAAVGPGNVPVIAYGHSVSGGIATSFLDY